jgi:hypothetical protein
MNCGARRAKELEKSAAEKKGGALRGKDTRSLYRKVVEKLNLATLLEDANLKTKLVQAGLPGPGPGLRLLFRPLRHSARAGTDRNSSISGWSMISACR